MPVNRYGNLTNSFARMPPPTIPGLWWLKSLIAIDAPGPTSSKMSSSNKPNAPVYACPWRFRPTQSYRLPTPAGNCFDFEFSSNLGVSVAEAAITMMSAVCTCFVLSRSK